MNERLPPMSAVRTLPELMTSNVALAMLFARWSRLSAARVRPRPERAVRARDVPKVTEHHGRAEDHRCGVGLVRAHDVLGDVTAAGLEKRVLLQNRTRPGSVNVKRKERTRETLTLPTLQPGTIPGPPTSAAPMLDTMAPYRLGMTITSNCVGRATSCMDLCWKLATAH